MTVPLPLPDVADQLALLLRATVLIGAAWAAASALRRAGASAAARHMAWLLGIAALLALPALWGLVPALRLPILPAESATAMAPPSFGLAGPVPVDAPTEAGWSLVLLAVYLLGTATLLLRLVVGRRLLKRLWSDAGTASDPDWERLLAQLSREMRLSRRVELRISRGPAVPMTWGTLAPKLLLPAEASGWPLERRRLVLLHELAHVARLDSFSRSAASLACALYWFHPGAWFAARRMRMEQEHAADDHVLMAGGSPQAYALSLLHLARGAGARPQFDQAAAMAGMYQLERRLVAITSATRRNRPGNFFLSSSALLAGLTTLLAAAGVPVSASRTSLGPLQANRTDTASSFEQDAVSRLTEDSSIGAGRAESRSAPAGPGNRVERLAMENPAASVSRPEEPAEAREVAQRAPSRRDGTVPNGSEPTNPDSEGSRNSEQPLRNYGWELPRRGSNGQITSQADPSRPTRLTVPPPIYSASSERTGRPRWARNIPRLVRGDKPAGSPHSTAQGPLTLSWSIPVGKQ